ncbi:MAG: class I SAM-dependent methyltransferase [Spirochaetales bacterium]|nr:class I SAM-dependent methyltransferase [Spirochaetales bacterium]
MDFFDDRKNVDKYIKMAEGYDGKELIALLEQHLPAGSAVLELGMGPGTDLDILAKKYQATGSDLSEVFIKLYKQSHPAAAVHKLDAVSIDIELTFDCIYSNKVLHHLAKPDLHRSFQRQRKLLTDRGIVMHSFWYGDTEEEIEGLRFVYYTESDLVKTIGDGFNILEVKRYKEFEDDDSFYVLARKL